MGYGVDQRERNLGWLGLGTNGLGGGEKAVASLVVVGYQWAEGGERALTFLNLNLNYKI